MQYNPHAHHRRSIRLPAYDYRQAGAYFVTICTFERVCILEDAQIRIIAERAWRRVTGHSRGGLMDEFVIMPNHVHGVIWIVGRDAAPVGAQHPPGSERHAAGENPPGSGHRTACLDAAPLPGPAGTRRAVAPGSLGTVVRAFKSVTCRGINRIRGTPGAPVWQRNYYERIIRDEDELGRIRHYIRDNPAKWADDPNNPANTQRPTSPINPVARRGAS